MSNIGFKTANEFSLHLEKLKLEKGFQTYTETLVYFYEEHSDHEMETLVKMLNRNIIEQIESESIARGVVKSDRVTFE